MQALMLAAGMGKRLQKYTKNQTKCMLEVAGKTLLERACDALKKSGIHKLILVVGYECDSLVEYAKSSIKDMEFEFVYNYDYAKTNNIYSLYMARDFLVSDDTILLESDLIYDDEIIEMAVKSEKKNLAVVAKYEFWMDGTVCLLDRDGNIQEFVDKKDFNYDNVDQYYKTVNIYKFSKEFAKEKYIPFLETYINVYGVDQYYESVLKIISHINKMDLSAMQVNGYKWYEIDNAQDLDIASTMFHNEEGRLISYEQHYGGYWRFPKIFDYCYLVNPYFPTEKMQRQMKYMYSTLLTQYPSGMKVQKLNAARIFNVDEEDILVGNGAAELINVLGRISKGTIGLPIPAFNEYIRCFENCNRVEIVSKRDDLSLEIEDILETISKVNILALVNPDNPSGQMIGYSDMMKLIQECYDKNVTCIIDESFVDFAERDRRYTLITKDILKKYPNLVVIKSISKSYGVPGLRLGVLATTNAELRDEIIKNLAIWNINSFAEYFLEILPLYRKPYVDACDKLAEQRRFFMGELTKIPYLQVYPSEANYIMCKVKNIKARELASIMLDKYSILIKDLSTKTGFDGRQYIRIAVKSGEENEKCIKALTEIGEMIHG